LSSERAPWEFGVEPLPQTRQVAELLRRVTGLLLSLEGEDPAVENLIVALERAEENLKERVPTELAPRVGAASAAEGRVYLDHSRAIGSYDPCFPEYVIKTHGPRATGTVVFPIPYEGPPGFVHGGFLGVFFDCAVQHHNCDLGEAGKTTAMAVRYRRPAPLLTTLSFVIDRESKEGRIESHAQLFDGDVLLCEATVDAVAAERSVLPVVDPRRSTA